MKFDLNKMKIQIFYQIYRVILDFRYAHGISLWLYHIQVFRILFILPKIVKPSENGPKEFRVIANPPVDEIYYRMCAKNLSILDNKRDVLIHITHQFLHK